MAASEKDALRASCRADGDDAGTPPRKGSKSDGAQSIHRSLQIIRILSSAPWQGMKLVDIAALTDLSHPTAYRILRALESEGVVERSADSRRYVIGTEMAWLGLRAAQRFPIATLAAPALDRVADETGDTIIMCVRSGSYSVCVDRRDGRYSTRVTAAAIGARRPLGTTPAGLTMLAFLPERTLRPIMDGKIWRTNDHGAFSHDVTHEIGSARQQGYLFCEGITVRDTRAITVPILDAGGTAIAALSAIATRSRFTERRLSSVVEALNVCSRATSAALLHNAVHQARGRAV